MPIPREVSGTIACSDQTHRLLSTGDGLRLLDHEDERDHVFLALGGTSACHDLSAAWDRLLNSYVAMPPDRQLRLLWVETLMPEQEFPDWHRDHQVKVIEGAARLASDARRPCSSRT